MEGTGDCPPEDCGGPHGYAHLLDVLADPQHEEPEGFRAVLGGLAVAALAVSGPLPPAELIRRVVPLMGEGWAVEGRPLVDADVGSMLREVSAELRALDLLAGDWATWEAGPSARTLLPRATATADLWARKPAW